MRFNINLDFPILTVLSKILTIFTIPTRYNFTALLIKNYFNAIIKIKIPVFRNIIFLSFSSLHVAQIIKNLN